MKHIKRFNENYGNDKGDHPQLAGLQALWNYPDDVLNAVLWANTEDDNDERELAIGYASQYINYMESVVGTDNPAEAWYDWCIHNNIEHEADNNPYL